MHTLKNKVLHAVIGATFSGAVLLTSCNGGGGTPPPDDKPKQPSTYLPQDAMDYCPIAKGEFDSWFFDGKAATNGFVTPYHSDTFQSHGSNCTFYKWSQRMFLWITSPASAGGLAGGGTVMESPVFYTVQPQKDNYRAFVPHEPGQPLRAVTSITQNGPNNLPVLRARNGKMYEVIKQASMPARKVSLQGMAQIAGVVKDGGRLKLVDKANNEVAAPKPSLAGLKMPGHVAVQQVINGTEVYLTQNDGAVEIETGQAGGGNVLMTQNGGLVYYLLFVNDVYVWYQYAATKNLLPAADTLTFPTDTTTRSLICGIARQNGATLVDSNALAMELKSSWVETKYVADSTETVNITAIVPAYAQTDSAWVPIPDSTRTVRLAMLGMHVVGSAHTHPEMIWATFEYKRNAPANAYDYVDKKNNTVHVNRPNTKGWLFCNVDSTTPDSLLNISHMRMTGDTIKATSGNKIDGSNTALEYAWGSYTMTPNPLVTSAAMSNSQVISSNNAIQSLLPGKDVRKNYIMIGAEWNDGVAPDGNNYPGDTTEAAAIGTGLLANSTMETEVQFGFNGTPAQNGGCFNCHTQSLVPSAAFDLSHIYSKFRRGVLPTVPTSLKK